MCRGAGADTGTGTELQKCEFAEVQRSRVGILQDSKIYLFF
jgi:hypothetical protein